MRTKPLWSIFVLICLLATAVAPMASAQDGGERAQTFVVGVGSQNADPSNLNIYAPGVSRSNTGLHQLVYEYFFYYNLQTGEYIPWLATDYAYNADNTALTVHLRDGVTWSDGQPFTADDVVFTYDLLRANPGMTWAAEATAAVESVEAIDPLTVQFNLTSPNPRLHLIREAFPAVGVWGGLTILPKHIWEAEADPLTFKSSPPVGTGAYVLSDASQNSMTYTRRDDWWGTEVFGHTPAPQTIQFLYVGPETNIAQSLTANDLDVAPIGVLSPGSFLEVASRNDAVRAWSTDSPYAWGDPCPRVLMVQNANAPLDNPDVRWALSYLIDRQSIVDLAYEGTTVPAWGIWPEYEANQPYFDAIEDLRTQYPSDAYDPDKGTEMLTAAGVNPEDLSLSFVVNADSAEEMAVSQVVKDQLETAGLSVEIQALKDPTLADTKRRGDYDLSFNAFCPGYIVENLELFHSKFYVPLGEPAPWFERNSFRYQNTAFDGIVDQMIAASPDDTATLTGLYHEAMAIWLADLPVIPLTQAPALVPFNSTYWSGWPTSEDPWNMPVSWWATFNLVVTGYPDASGAWVGGLQPASGS